MKKHRIKSDPFWVLAEISYSSFNPFFLRELASDPVDRVNPNRNYLRSFLNWSFDKYRGMDYEET